jgi:hypothetical protein
MLNALLRTASLIALLGGTGCTFGSSPNVGQSSGNNSSRKKVDAGSEDAEARRVSTASGDVRSRDAEADAEIDSRSTSAGAGGAAGQSGAAGKSSTTKNTAGKGGTGGKQAEEPKQPEPEEPEPAPEQPENQPPSTPAATDAGTRVSTDAGPLPPLDAAVDAGPRPMVDDPTGVLGDLANRTAGSKTAATIDQFFETLAMGEAPATSIRDFLLAIDDEVDCVMNPFATECLAACQAVSTTCAVCVFDTECRSTMLSICGYSALAGCVPRR